MVADVPRDTPGGIRSYLLCTGAALEEAGHPVDYLFLEDLRPGLLRGRRARRLGVPWIIVIEVLRRRGRYDVVQVHETAASAYCRLRPWLPGLPPCVVASWGAEERYWREYAVRATRGRVQIRKGKGLWNRLLIRQSRLAFRKADHILVPSEDDLHYLADELGIAPERMTRVDSGVDESYFSVQRRDRRNGVRIAFVGAWCDKKGAPEIVEAWKRVTERNRSASLSLLCTASPAETVLTDFGPFRDRVTVQPFMSDADLRDALAVHDAFVLPSWFEGGMSLAAQQAASAGLACVVTSISGHADLFRQPCPEEDGALVVPPHDAEALSDALARLLNDEELVARLGVRARRRARAFSWRETARRSLEAYQRALERTAGAA
jgi:glycosyltransferase involved in cell wall biosynthesis